jgi:hypothetical protein
MRCPACNKFAGLDTNEPEVNFVDIDDGGHVTADVRLVRVSSCCNEEMKEATFTLEADVDVTQHQGEGHELTAEEGSVDVIEEGGHRYAKSYHGVQLTVNVTCSCGKLNEVVEMSDKVCASGMEELC